MELINITTGHVLALDIKIADSFISRLLGLMFKKNMPKGNAIHIQPCKSIHTFFMKFPIDVIYLDANNKIVGIEETLGTGKVGKLFRGARSVIELPAGRIGETTTKIGDMIQYK